MKLWGGRFTEGIHQEALKFHSSVSFDKRLYRQDILGSIAHAKMLGEQSIIPLEDTEKITKALAEILEGLENGQIMFDESAEDIHSFIEAALIARIGSAGGRLHTGRSRNDQVALDMRLYVRATIRETQQLLADLLVTLLTMAKEQIRTIMPGYTHMQKAQPITLAHHLLAYFQMFKRDFQRLGDCYTRADEMPLGSGALAATTYPLNRNAVKEQLGFGQLTANSLDGVSDRDFCIEFLSDLSLIMMHLSRFCEEIILWATDEFKFIEISDGYATGSSIMPQKKNPDMAELIRGKTGRVYGSLMGLLTVMKGLPLAYNKDMQEDKEAVFDASDTVKACLSIFDDMLKAITFKTDRLYHSAQGGYTNATDAADWLVKQGLPFREAHEIIGKLVLYAIQEQKPLEQLTIAELKAISPVFDETVYEAIALTTCVNARNVEGGPSEAALLQAIGQAEDFLSCHAR